MAPLRESGRSAQFSLFFSYNHAVAAEFQTYQIAKDRLSMSGARQVAVYSLETPTQMPAATAAELLNDRQLQRNVSKLRNYVALTRHYITLGLK